MTKEFDNLKQAIRGQLEKDRSALSKEELDFLSTEIATTEWKALHNNQEPKKEKLKQDSDGMFIVGENVKILIESTISEDSIIKE